MTISEVKSQESIQMYHKFIRQKDKKSPTEAFLKILLKLLDMFQKYPKPRIMFESLYKKKSFRSLKLPQSHCTQYLRCCQWPTLCYNLNINKGPMRCKNARDQNITLITKSFRVPIVKHKNDVAEPQRKVNRNHVLPITLSECFLKIATHLSYKPNFVNYMFREDMICDGIENCVQYIHNFNPEKSSNPFAYFTQIIHYAFLRRIQKEKNKWRSVPKSLRGLVTTKCSQ